MLTIIKKILRFIWEVFTNSNDRNKRNTKYKRRRKSHLVYRATNNKTGEVYVGYTGIGIENRKQYHKQDALEKKKEGRFWQAIRDYGWHNFRWEILEHLPNTTKFEARKIEMQYIEANVQQLGSRQVYNKIQSWNDYYYHQKQRKAKLQSSKPQYRRGRRRKRRQNDNLVKVGVIFVIVIAFLWYLAGK